MNRIVLALGVALLALEVAAALWILTDNEEIGWTRIALAVSVGVTFVISGLIAITRRPENRTGVYLLGVGYLWFLGALTDAGNDWLFAIGFAGGNIVWAPFTALVLAYPSGQLRSRLDRAIPVATAVALVGSGIAVLLFDPDVGPFECTEDCASSPIAIADLPGLANAFNLLGSLLGLILISIVIVKFVRRWRSATPALRRLLWPVLGSASAALVAVGLVVIHDTVSDTAAPFLEGLFLAALCSVPLAFLFGILRTRLARSSVTAVVVALQAGVPIADALASGLADPSLTLAYRRSDGSQWVDSEGRRVPEPARSPGREITYVEQAGEPIAAIVHDESLADSRELLDAVSAAASLSIQNERLQAELRAQVAMLTTVTNTTPSLLVDIDTDGRIVALNRAAAGAAGVADPDDVRHRFFWDVFIDPSERAAVIERFHDPAVVATRRDFEDTFVNARGERRVINWQTAPVLDEAGNIERIVAGGVDVTVRVHRELELQRERDATTTVLMTIPSVIVVMDREFVIRDRHVDDPRAAVNRAFRELTGWRDEQVVHRDFRELVIDDEDGHAQWALDMAAQGVSSAPVESMWRSADGGEVPFEWTAAPVSDVTGRTDGLILVSGVDITERREQDAALRAHEQEVHASRARIVAAADDARRVLERNLHDGAQQRLVALSVTLRLAESKLATDPAEAATIIAGAREELSHALDDLRELARGIHPAILTDRGLKPAVEALVARVPVPVDLELPVERLPLAVEAASYYVVAESLTNVAKYAGACTARVAISRDDGRVVVEVSDDGCGGADPGAGSGLRGLQDRVAALDGTLAVESPMGVGTSVRAEIPLAPEPTPTET